MLLHASCVPLSSLRLHSQCAQSRQGASGGLELPHVQRGKHARGEKGLTVFLSRWDRERAENAFQTKVES